MTSFFALSPPAQYFLFLTLIFIPLAGIASYIRIRSGKPLRPKRQRYIAAIVMQLIILTATVLAAHAEGITLLGRRWGNILIWIGVAAYMAFLTVRLRAAWAKLSDDRKEKARILLPDHPSLMRLWVGVAALAGVSEECAYRGLAYQMLRGMGLHVALTLLLCVSAFAIGHMTQGWRGVLGTFLLALVFHGLVFATDSLYLAIAFHAVYNLTVGVIAVPILSEYAKRRELTQAAEAQAL
jgi:membrane protease YdiL (CAAX protease family)